MNLKDHIGAKYEHQEIERWHRQPPRVSKT